MYVWVVCIVYYSFTVGGHLGPMVLLHLISRVWARRVYAILVATEDICVRVVRSRRFVG